MVTLRSVYDSYVFHEWPSLSALAPYMPGDWGSIVPERLPLLASPRLYPDPRGGKASNAIPEGRPAGSDVELLTTQVLAQGKRDRVILGYDDGLFSTVQATRNVADVIARAANDWTVAEWFPADGRFYGLVLVATATPQAAAAEIRRIGMHERMVGIALGGNGLSRPFGHAAYHPIYEAASELGLPIVIQAGPSDAFGDAQSSPVAGGYTSTTAEYRALMWHSHCAHLSSLIVEGAFTLFPRLRVVIANGGVTWLGGQLLRLDYWYRGAQPEARWLDRLPSEYFPDHVRVMTHGMETAPRPEALLQALETIPAIDRVLLYGSGYPDADWAEPEAVAERLPSAWHDRVFFENALETFRWPETCRAARAVLATDGEAAVPRGG